ncbi:carbamoyl-phosphate synthase [Bacillus thuringiensis]|uniref:phage tail protein n=1 Tax=Bacillus thuringiensis TaxID=1428 RepID=UPI00333BB4AC
MADGRVEIDTRLDTGNIRSDVQRVNRELGQVGSNMSQVGREMRNTFGNEFTQLNRQISSGYSNISAASRSMMNEMKNSYKAQKQGMGAVRDQQIQAQYGYFKLAQSSQIYAGTTRQFMSEVQALGTTQKKANDAAINGNRMVMMGMLQTIGYMQNMTTQATRIRENYVRMGNPLYTINNAGLRTADALNRMANAGNASVLALKMLGPTANMKDLVNMQLMITQGLLRVQMVAIMAAASCALLYGSLHNANMEMNPKYAEAYSNMLEKLSKAFQPMKDAFAAMMIPVYNFIAAIAELIIKFNEAHPVLAKFIQGTMMLLPLLTLILSPLAIGIGLWNGMLAAWSSIWMLIGPLITGLAAMSATVWVVAAAIVGLTMYLSHLWKTNERFQTGIMQGIGAIKAFGQAIVALGKYLFWTAVDGDYLNDWITHLPESFQPAAEKIGLAVSKIHDSVAVAIGAVSQFGQHILSLGKYLFWTAVDGDYLNDWITHLPVGFQTAAELLGRAVAAIREQITQLVEAVRLALGGDTSQLGQIFMTIIPTLIGMLVGGFPALLLAATRFLPTIVEGINTNLPMITTTITNVITTMVDLITTYLPQFLMQGISILSKVIEGIVQVLPQVIVAIVDAATTMINAFVTIIGTLLPVILDAGIKILMAIIDGIVQNLPKIIDAALKVIDSLINTIVKLLPQIIDAGIKILMALIDGIIKILPQLIDTAIMLITKICDMVIQNLPKLIDAGIKILMALIDGIIKILPQLIDAGIKIIVKLVEVLIQNLPKLIDSGVKILTALIDGIIKILPKLIETGLKLIVEIAKAIIQNLPKVLEAGGKILLELIKGIVSLVGELGSTIKNNVIKSMTDKLDDAKTTFFNAGKGLMDQMKKGIENMKDKVLDTMSNMAGKVRDFLPFSPAKTGPLSDLDHLDFGGPISDSIKLAFPKVQGLMNDLLDLPPIVSNVKTNRTVESSGNTQRDTNNTGNSNGSSPTYIVLDKKVVGEALAEPVESTNNRRKQRLAQFKPTVTPSF